MEANRKNINAAFAKMQQEAKQLGVELLTKPEVFIDDDHLCCVWYGGYIGGFMYKDYTVALEVHGDVVICGVVDGKDFEYTNRLNNGAMSMAASDHLRTAFKSDAELDKAIEDESSIPRTTGLRFLCKDRTVIGAREWSWTKQTMCWTPAEISRHGSSG